MEMNTLIFPIQILMIISWIKSKIIRI